MHIQVNGRDFQIDPEDIPILDAHSWSWHRIGYLITKIGKGKRRTIGIHRLIMGDPEGLTIDHINRDPSDNRRSNLRICTQSENNMNRRTSDNPERGVTQRRGKWQVIIRVNGKLKWFGQYDSKEQAVSVAQEQYRHIAA